MAAVSNDLEEWYASYTLCLGFALDEAQLLAIGHLQQLYRESDTTGKAGGLRL